MPAPRLAEAARTEFLKPKSITRTKARVLGPRLGGASAASFLKAASHSETQEYDGHRTITAPRFEPMITGDRAGVSMGVGAIPVTLVSKTNDVQHGSVPPPWRELGGTSEVEIHKKRRAARKS